MRNLYLLLVALLLTACAPTEVAAQKPSTPVPAPPPPAKTEKAVLAGGCFWCLDGIFSRVRGVYKVTSGFSGGTLPHPDYKTVCTGTTGHAESVEIEYDPSQISYHDLLEVFFGVHDPTTLNRQGPDEGTQYRSAIFYATPEQKKVAEEVIQEQKSHFKDPIVTQVQALTDFYPAEDYHQDYFQKNPNQAYCSLVIAPKVKKFLQKFPQKVKQ